MSSFDTSGDASLCTCRFASFEHVRNTCLAVNIWMEVLCCLSLTTLRGKILVGRPYMYIGSYDLLCMFWIVKIHMSF